MDDRQALTQLRSLVVLADGDGLVAVLSRRPWPDHSLQLIGEGLLAAVRDGTRGAVELAIDCVGALRRRRWEGDGKLADALDALGEAPVPMLRALAVDLGELAMVLEGDPVHGGGRIDLATGEVWPESAIEYAQEVGDDVSDDPDRWLWVECEGPRSGYGDPL